MIRGRKSKTRKGRGGERNRKTFNFLHRCLPFYLFPRRTFSWRITDSLQVHQYFGISPVHFRSRSSHLGSVPAVLRPSRVRAHTFSALSVYKRQTNCVQIVIIERYRLKYWMAIRTTIWCEKKCRFCIMKRKLAVLFWKWGKKDCGWRNVTNVDSFRVLLFTIFNLFNPDSREDAFFGNQNYLPFDPFFVSPELIFS